ARSRRARRPPQAPARPRKACRSARRTLPLFASLTGRLPGVFRATGAAGGKRNGGMGSGLMQFRRLVIGVIAAGIAGLVIVAAFVAYSAYTLPLTHSPASEMPQGAVVYANSAGEPFAARGVFRGDHITADHLPQNLVNAVIAIEDRRFYQHHGIDPRGILRAAGHNLFHPHNVEGASTITQQLARLSYLSSERTL